MRQESLLTSKVFYGFGYRLSARFFAFQVFDQKKDFWRPLFDTLCFNVFQRSGFSANKSKFASKRSEVMSRAFANSGTGPGNKNDFIFEVGHRKVFKHQLVIYESATTTSRHQSSSPEAVTQYSIPHSQQVFFRLPPYQRAVDGVVIDTAGKFFFIGRESTTKKSC